MSRDLVSSANGSTNSASARQVPARQLTSQQLVQGLEPFFASPVPRWKRALDIVGSGVMLIVFSPTFLLTAILIKVVSPGPVFFKQERVGHGGNLFFCWKFRTMKVDADTSVHADYVRAMIKKGANPGGEKPMVKLDFDDDSRIIRFGRILRESGLDELPQLINVLRGEMSLVGPRPCIAYEAQEYLPWQRQRFDTIPGLTGLWQVSGKNKTTFNEMMRLDIAYEKQKSFWLDVKLLLRTLPAVLDQIIRDQSSLRTAELTEHRNGEIMQR